MFLCVSNIYCNLELQQNTAAHFDYCFHVVILALWSSFLMAAHYAFCFSVLLYCLELQQEIRVRFRASKTT